MPMLGGGVVFQTGMCTAAVILPKSDLNVDEYLLAYANN